MRGHTYRKEPIHCGVSSVVLVIDIPIHTFTVVRAQLLGTPLAAKSFRATTPKSCSCGCARDEGNCKLIGIEGKVILGYQYLDCEGSLGYWEHALGGHAGPMVHHTSKRYIGA